MNLQEQFQILKNDYENIKKIKENDIDKLRSDIIVFF